jgi:hypothetical protein
VAVLVVVGLVYYTRRTSAEPGTIHGVMLKLWLNSLQVLALATSFDFHWTASIQALLDALSVTSSAGDSVFALDCFLADPVNVVYIQACLYATLPLTSFAMQWVAWKAQCRWANDTDLASFKRKLTSSCIVVNCMIYASVARSALMLLMCKPRGLDKTTYLYLDQDVQCWTAAHWPWVFLVSLPSLIGFVIGFPVACVWLLRKNEVPRAIERWNSGAPEEADMHNVEQFAYLFKGYKAKAYYW